MILSTILKRLRYAKHLSKIKFSLLVISIYFNLLFQTIYTINGNEYDL